MPTPTTLPILSFENETTFENWLSENHLHSTGIWLKIFKKGSKQQTVTYAEALHVALRCVMAGSMDKKNPLMNTLGYRSFVLEVKKAHGLKSILGMSNA
jgi:hypothetical protein